MNINFKSFNTASSKHNIRNSLINFKGTKFVISQGDTIEIRGNETNAKVYIKNINQLTQTQIEIICSHPVFRDMPIRIMPDTHAGKVNVVGFTAPINPKGEVIPGIIGNDIGCGMLCTEIESLEDEIDFEKLDKVVRQAVHLQGHNINSKQIPEELSQEIEDVCAEIDTTTSEIQLSKLGTLGGGNHFVELDKDKDGKVYLVIHSGSRDFGGQIANKYGQIARQQNPHTIEELSHLSDDEAKAYMKDMRIAQKYAQFNRELIVRTILSKMGWQKKDSFESVHNYIDENGIIRKGAISANDGEKVIIPLNMRDGALIAKGKGNADWNNSAPHGAGRILSRTEASKKVDLDEYKKSMEGIYTTCVCERTLDEAPQAYKDSAEIERCIGPTVEITDKIRPLYNFKNKK